ncbi:hypothetical protein GCM10022225_46050 [Plantactinospora mayteni]|uniref:Secreted protein n=1 Tax=Plantactinospora mayteni TaxID=566021 RepID=A0ABQ4EXC8_9ACTN|nr:hypothetical protein [Plantactinospora mayteni]GIG99317.1 hypothetical protein Pma05_58900 [Plantactinospora mayteni]
MKSRRILSGLAAAALAAAASLTFAAPASAATWDEWMYTDDADPGGVVRFRADGDVVQLCDIEADGWKVYLDVDDNTQSLHKYELSVGGNGNCIETRASFGSPYDLREGNVFRFTIWLDNDDNPGSYGDTAYWANVN